MQDMWRVQRGALRWQRCRVQLAEGRSCCASWQHGSPQGQQHGAGPGRRPVYAFMHLCMKRAGRCQPTPQQYSMYV